VTVPVDPVLEVSGLVHRVVREDGPALLFERPGSSRFPLAMNRFGAARRVELALGRDPGEIGLELVEAIQRLNPPSLGAFWAARGFLARGRHLRTREVRRAPVQEVAEAPDPGRLPLQGPFGDHYGHYSVAAEFPVFHVQRVTRRRDASCPATIVGKPPQEDKFLGIAVGEMVGPLIRLVNPNVLVSLRAGRPDAAPADRRPGHARLHLVRHARRQQAGPRRRRLLDGGFLVVTVDRDPRAVLETLLRWPGLGEVRFIAAVSRGVDLQDETSLLWGSFTRFDPVRDMIFARQDFVGARPVYGGPIGIDCTWKEGYPVPVEMPPEIIRRVDQRWGEYFGKAGGRGHGKRGTGRPPNIRSSAFQKQPIQMAEAVSVPSSSSSLRNLVRLASFQATNWAMAASPARPGWGRACGIGLNRALSRMFTPGPAQIE
jgi:3-polyprenyl-4-hydroxybenzoate decarboxylase